MSAPVTVTSQNVEEHRRSGLIVDSFAGMGGASFGIKLATGREPDLAINHNAEAIALHARNHPTTEHLCESVWRVDPRDAAGDEVVDLLWSSPDCKHFSKAKGGKPVEQGVRGLAWVVVAWARKLPPWQRPRLIYVENVEEFQDWGPLLADGTPDPEKRGREFKRWVGHLRGLGYVVQWRELRACDYGAPTSRRRLFLIARCDGRPIVWPAPTHAPRTASPDLFSASLPPWRTAAECIEWDVPCPSIFQRRHPLADKRRGATQNGSDVRPSDLSRCVGSGPTELRGTPLGRGR